jgi:hypothetical protein
MWLERWRVRRDWLGRLFSGLLASRFGAQMPINAHALGEAFRSLDLGNVIQRSIKGDEVAAFLPAGEPPPLAGFKVDLP